MQNVFVLERGDDESATMLGGIALDKPSARIPEHKADCVSHPLARSYTEISAIRKCDRLQREQPTTMDSSSNGAHATMATLRRRNAHDGSLPPPDPPAHRTKSSVAVVKKLDFMFPKVDTEYTFQTESGGIASLVAYLLIGLLVLAETLSWYAENQSTLEHIHVDTSLGKQMRVNLNITFPSLSCQDLHVDVMDVAGDAQLDVADTLKKRAILKSGRLSAEEEVDLNQHRINQVKKDEVLKTDLPADYCGPCYGAHETEGQCCNTCDELLEAYKKKNWKEAVVQMFSEQCIREGRDHKEPKRMTKGEGCQVYGYMTLNRVAGNFHIAMGEGVERDGRHIHSFIPEDAPNFNASHIIHDLSFGPAVDEVAVEKGTLTGLSKIVTKEHGTTGLFQYFIKIVPTTYIGKGDKGATSRIETNRYFYTERFRPLMNEYLEDDHFDNQDQASVESGGGHKADHHNVRNSVLPGVFFMYEIYPFEVEVSQVRVPLTHLLIRLMATVGGVFTIVRWADNYFSERRTRR
jgi:endoplasmic reticulum-Golgi intermediate compartment protein 3